MKKLLTMCVLLLGFSLCFSQIPSINENNNFVKNSFSDKEAVRLTSEKNLMMRKISSSKKEAEVLKKENNLAKLATVNQAIAIDSIELQKLKDNLKNLKINDPIRIGYDKYYNNKILVLTNEKIALENSIAQTGDIEMIDKIKDQIDQKINEIKNTEEEKMIKLVTLDSTYNWFLPSANRIFRKQFFERTYNNKVEKTNYLNSFAILDDKNSTTVQSELISDYLCFSRIAFGTVITPTKKNDSETAVNKEPGDNSTQTETAEDALSRLINGGGNFYLEFVVPLMTTYDGQPDDIFTFYSYANLRGATDIKNFGNNIDTSTANGSLGLYAYGSASSDSKKFNFFLQGNLNFSFGSNQFYENLGLPNHNGFIHGKLIAGLTLLNTFRLSAIINTVGSNEALRSGRVVFGVQFLPDLLKK